MSTDFAQRTDDTFAGESARVRVGRDDRDCGTRRSDTLRLRDLTIQQRKALCMAAARAVCAQADQVQTIYARANANRAPQTTGMRYIRAISVCPDVPDMIRMAQGGSSSSRRSSSEESERLTNVTAQVLLRHAPLLYAAILDEVTAPLQTCLRDRMNLHHTVTNDDHDAARGNNGVCNRDTIYVNTYRVRRNDDTDSATHDANAAPSGRVHDAPGRHSAGARVCVPCWLTLQLTSGVVVQHAVFGVCAGQSTPVQPLLLPTDDVCGAARDGRHVTDGVKRPLCASPAATGTSSSSLSLRVGPSPTSPAVPSTRQAAYEDTAASATKEPQSHGRCNDSDDRGSAPVSLTHSLHNGWGGAPTATVRQPCQLARRRGSNHGAPNDPAGGAMDCTGYPCHPPDAAKEPRRLALVKRRCRDGSWAALWPSADGSVPSVLQPAPNSQSRLRRARGGVGVGVGVGVGPTGRGPAAAPAGATTEDGMCLTMMRQRGASSMLPEPGGTAHAITAHPLARSAAASHAPDPYRAELWRLADADLRRTLRYHIDLDDEEGGIRFLD